MSSSSSSSSSSSPFRKEAVLLSVALLGAAAILRSPAAHAEPSPMKVAVVDIQRAAFETEDGLRAQATLKKYSERRNMELAMRQDELERKRGDIEKQSKVLSKEALARALEDWQKQAGELQAVYMDYTRDIQKKQQDIAAPILGRLQALVRKIALRDNVDIVFDRQATPYARPELDITDQIIIQYNAGEAPPAEPASSAAPPASGAVAPAAPTAPAGSVAPPTK
jgi:outer membrane protein